MLGDLAGGGMLGAVGNATSLALLTGSLPVAERRRVLGEISSGQVGIVVGTHALLSDVVEFADLGLIVIDEQHRFGVEQRDALRAKSKEPAHVLVMTATPIPRTIAMTVFGDLDVSILDELPLGRTPISTHVISTSEKPSYLKRAWERVREEVSQGRQVYIVAPRISAEDDSDFNSFGLDPRELAIVRRLNDEMELEPKFPMSSVEELFPTLKDGALSGLRIGRMHGRLPNDEKDAVMSRFAAGELDVLISTTVIEVGVDVANASMIVIMDADRFGVSQLHQLRGRVGRGSTPGLCLLVTNLDGNSPAMARLTAVASTTDGFELSRLDLEQRREGDVLGSAQSGATSHLRLLRVIRDEELISQAREVAEELLQGDPRLENSVTLRGEVDKLRQEERASFLEKK
jgi:ATP-dependent DNA helicase RecG